MRQFALILLFCPLFIHAQSIPDFGFDKVRIIGSKTIIQADLLPSKKKSPKIDRNYYWYNANSIQCTQGGYSGSLLNGNYSEYYLNKNLKEQGKFKNGLKFGVWKNWYENGILLSVYTWNDGFKCGNYLIYNDQGKVSRSGRYKNDVINVDSIPFLRRINIFRRKKHDPSK